MARPEIFDPPFVLPLRKGDRKRQCQGFFLYPLCLRGVAKPGGCRDSVMMRRRGAGKEKGHGQQQQAMPSRMRLFFVLSRYFYLISFSIHLERSGSAGFSGTLAGGFFCSCSSRYFTAASMLGSLPRAISSGRS